MISTTKKQKLQEHSLVISGKELKKSVGFLYAFAYLVSLLFGNGIFISPGLIARRTSNMGMALIVWVICGIPAILGALCYVELACMLRKTGGRYLFILETYGKGLGFIAIWTQIFVTTPTSMSVLAIAIGEHMVAPYYDIGSNGGVWLVKGVAFACVTLAAVINSTSTTFISKTQVFFAVTQTASVCFLAALGVWRVSTGHTSNYQNMFNGTDFDTGRFGLALYSGLWAYSAWGVTGTMTEELRDLQHDLWLSVVTGIPFVIFCYVLINLAFLSSLTHAQIASSSTVATTFVEATLGRKVALVVPIAVGLSCFGTLNGAFFMVSRILLSSAREGQIPEALSYIHKYRRTPIPAVLFLLILTVPWILVAGRGTETLITYFSFAIWLTHLPAILAVIVLRFKMPYALRPIKVWYITPVFASLVAVFLVIIPFIERPVESTICLDIMMTACPVYWLCFKSDCRLPDLFQRVRYCIHRFMTQSCNLVPCIYEAVENDAEEVVV